ncbi:MAG: 4Fe-4S binding protein, partial [Peptococcus niger]
PGQVPYRPYYTPRDRNDVKINFIAIKPKTHKDLCIDCKRCAEICPLGSIDWDQVAEVAGKCMKCCGCIKKCPTGAKYFDDPGFLYHKSELEYLYADHRCEPVYYL